MADAILHRRASQLLEAKPWLWEVECRQAKWRDIELACAGVLHQNPYATVRVQFQSSVITAFTSFVLFTLSR